MKYLIPILALLIVLPSCVKATKPAMEEEEPVFVVEEDTTAAETVEVFQETEIPETTMEETTVTTPETTTAETTSVITPPPEVTTVETKKMGYRVQIGAFSSMESAERFADRVRSRFTVGVYVQYVPPYYKVRVGDFLTRAEADNFKLKVWEMGFTDAFVVESEITQ